MAPKSKSIFRQPGTQHFQLVHRSQRDPLIHDPDAPQHVLKPFTRDNDQRKGKSRSDLESLLSPSDLSSRPNVGEASLYGIYYDDTEYDYMQHLRTVGVQEDGVESTLISAPIPTKSKGKGKDRAPIDLKEDAEEGVVPASVLASKTEMPRNYESGAAVPSALAGFQPDMDPHLRQALEALEDDAFVDDTLADDDGDDFFGELVKDGERGDGEEFEYEFDEDGLEVEEEVDDDAPLEARVAAFKRRQQAAASDDGEDEDYGSEGADTIGRLPEFSVVGGKKRRTGGSDASGYSMSSSAMARTESMRLLDDHFEVFEQKHYGEDEDEQDDEYIPDDDEDEAPDLIATREDFESMMDEFLDKFDVAGGKMKPVLEGDAAAKLAQIREAMGRDERQKEDSEGSGSEDDDEEIYAMLDKEDKAERWDVESVLTTHTNLENHPRLIRARTSKPVPKITLDPRTGLPIVTEPTTTKPKRQPRAPSPPTSDTASDSEDDRPRQQAVARPKGESKEEKKARKAAVKEQKSARRVEKKATKVAFGNAVRKETGVIAAQSVKTRKL